MCHQAYGHNEVDVKALCRGFVRLLTITFMQALSCAAAAQVLEARVDWAVWALDQGIVQAGELTPPEPLAPGQAAHIAAALQRFLEAALVADDGAGGERRNALLGLEPSMRRLAVRALELLNKVAPGFRRVCCVGGQSAGQAADRQLGASHCIAAQDAVQIRPVWPMPAFGSSTKGEHFGQNAYITHCRAAADCAQAASHAVIQAGSAGLQQLLLAALLAPQRLGVPPSDALTSRKLAAAARVRSLMSNGFASHKSICLLRLAEPCATGFRMFLFNQGAYMDGLTPTQD